MLATVAKPPVRIGLIGFGYIGSQLYRDFRRPDSGFELAFVCNRSAEKLQGLPAELICHRLQDVAAFRPDIIVEVSHPEVTVCHGVQFLEVADYLPLSVTALADDGLRQRLEDAANSSGHRLLIPHGALVAADDLFELRERWQEVSIRFCKPPGSIDFSRVQQRAEDITCATVIYDGPVRAMAELFPHNVNAMVTCALLTVGLDRCRGVLVADPTLGQLSARVEARASDGAVLITEKTMPAAGVSGTEMISALRRSIRKAAGLFDAMDYV